jgi:hypothetical protein
MLETASRQALDWRHTARPARCGMLPGDMMDAEAMIPAKTSTMAYLR